MLLLVGWELVMENSFCIASPAVPFVMLNIISDNACLLSHLHFSPCLIVLGCLWC